jgi:hypothetical protein
MLEKSKCERLFFQVPRPSLTDANVLIESQVSGCLGKRNKSIKECDFKKNICRYQNKTFDYSTNDSALMAQ